MPITPDLPQAELAIVEQTNVFRTANKLAPVKSDPLLVKSAREYARFLAASTVFSHEADGRRPVDRIKAAGYQPCATAENLAMRLDSRGFETLQLAGLMVEDWKSSPGHRKNLLMQHATETGVAIAKAARDEKYFAVQLFGRPQSLQYSFQIENTAAREVVYNVGGQEIRIAPREVMRHTGCMPAEIGFQLKSGQRKPGSGSAEAVTSRYEAKGGQVFRLTGGKGGDIAIDVSAK